MSKSNSDSSEQGLIDHLTELRRRLVYSVIIILLGFFGCWVFSDKIFDFIRAPILVYLPSEGLVFTAPMDKFMAHVKVCFLASIVLTSPFWIYQIWKFIEPALYKDEKKFGLFFIFFGSTLFTSGICFVYFFVFPLAFKFLLTFGGGVDKPLITITEYLSFFITITLVFGAAFEMPLIFTILGKIGLVEKEFLAKNRRYAVVILAALSAMLTPPDVISMGMMLMPMMALYELSIILVGIFGQANKKSE